MLSASAARARATSVAGPARMRSEGCKVTSIPVERSVARRSATRVDPASPASAEKIRMGTRIIQLA